ncbi:MAG: TPM domain-containing protein, partial [Gemmatimonadaceae bacterium]|nr:TPM domain-containing protein [Gemmatimonadaceae bacterium]
MTHLLLSLSASAVVLLQGIQIPQPTGYVNDFANVLSPSAEASMMRIIDDVRRKSGGEIVVVTLPDLQGRDVADVAREIGRQWRVGRNAEVGDRARNAGAVILIAPRETNSSGRGAARIETGLGTEGFITDATSGAILDEAVPFFQRQDYGAGVELITLRVAERFGGEFGFAIDTSFVAPTYQRGPAPARPRIPPQLIVIAIFLIFSMFGRGGRRGRRGPRGCMPLIIPMG